MRTAEIEIDRGYRVRCRVGDDVLVHKGDSCVVDIRKVREFGKVCSVGEGREKGAGPRAPRVIRQATLQDRAKAKEGVLRSKMARDSCAAKAEKYGFAMRFHNVRYSFDRTTLYLAYESEERVDYREMIKELAVELRANIEMQYLGVRDGAALCGGMGPCGRPQCCSTWLKRFESVNVKMAKIQHLSLNPAGITGMCGRLKCCLRYEVDTYRKLQKGMPREGDRVETPKGPGRVIGGRIIAQKVKVRLEDGREVTVKVDEARRMRGRMSR
ncbi:MAG: regulatory iron-sulfur-containing complex subunit RicT [Kiritimatiellia bacterium]